MEPRVFGAEPSKLDVRTFTYTPRPFTDHMGGTRYEPADIEDQSKVGICTAISLTQHARKALGQRFSADFQYLIQKRFYDNNWEEGSSIFTALRAARGIGLLPESEWKHTTLKDRDLPYHLYIEKLKAIPMEEIGRLILIANKTRLKAFASIPVTRDTLARAIAENPAGIIVRFNVGEEWYTDTKGKISWHKDDLEPLRPPQRILSGHAIIESNFVGNSFRVANTWGPEWCDKGTAYSLYREYRPTEAWVVYYNDVPAAIQAKLEARTAWTGKFLDYVQKILDRFI